MAGTIQTWSPFRQMDRFRREMDDLFDRFLTGGNESPRWLQDGWNPAVESFVEGEKLIIRADLPGVDPKNVDVSVTGDALTLSGSREAKHEEKDRDYLSREVFYGSFQRTLPLPEGIDREQIKASYRDGVLELVMPLPRKLAAKKVPIEVEHKKA